MRIASTLALILLATLARAEPYAAGSVLPPIALPDQHGAPHTIDASVRAVVFSRDMDAGDVVKAAVAKAGPDLFTRNRALYVVDVKGMPALIRSLFALPAMRRRPYILLVDEDGAKTADIPGGATYPAVLVLDELRVTSLHFPENADALIGILEPPAPE